LIHPQERNLFRELQPLLAVIRGMISAPADENAQLFFAFLVAKNTSSSTLSPTPSQSPQRT